MSEDLNFLMQARRDKLDRLRAAGVDPFAYAYDRTHTAREAVALLGDADEGNPTRGGLRIGKPLPERAASEAPDERQEWQRDGQYFHYLTRWMHALRAVGHATQSDVPLRWARELALTAHRAFSYRPRPGARLRMVWKMSIDLTRPLVASMGQHLSLIHI